jgi:hypothetical protein
MGRTRLFHTVVIVGSSLLANCDKGAPAKAGSGSSTQAKDAAATVLLDAAPEAVRVMAAPPPPRIHAFKPPKPLPPPPRIEARPHHHKKKLPAPVTPVAPEPARIMTAPQKVRIMAAPRPVRIMVAPGNGTDDGL